MYCRYVLMYFNKHLESFYYVFVKIELIIALYMYMYLHNNM